MNTTMNSTMNTTTDTTTSTDDTTTGAGRRSARSLARTRWAAIGAAVAVTIGGGGIGMVSATIDSGDKPLLVQIDPCRLVDTRPGTQVGPRNTPIGEGEQYDVMAHGMNGNCDIPADALGLSLNVTALNATAPTFASIFPADAPLPVTSNLNLLPGQAPSPNAVTTGLDADGEFAVYNAYGQIDVIVDVNGYYEDHNHDDRYVQQSDMLWAVVDANGTLVRSSDGVASVEILDGVLPTGDYVVTFDRDISQCAYQATVGRPGVNVNPLPGFAQVANHTDDPDNGVIVFTKDHNGSGTEARGFHLLVTC